MSVAGEVARTPQLATSVTSLPMRRPVSLQVFNVFLNEYTVEKRFGLLAENQTIGD